MVERLARPQLRERLAVGALAVVALVLFLAAPTYPNYDSYYNLVWGRELLDGRLPSFGTDWAPTQHPLYIALGVLAQLVFGAQADRALVGLGALSLVVLAWATWRVGRACFGATAGLFAALFVASSFAFLLYAARAYVDVPFLAVVLVAAAVEAQRPRGRPRTVMALLLAAGLLRPEAWVLSGLYWLWIRFGAAAGTDAGAHSGGAAADAGTHAAARWRLDLLALAAAGPLLWALVDGLVTGDPLHSLHATSDLAGELGRSRGIGAVPGSFLSFVFDVARPPVAAAGVLGLVLAWRGRGARGPAARAVSPPAVSAARPAAPHVPSVPLGSGPTLRALHVPLGLLAGGTLTFLATGVAGLSILPRYLTVPVVALCLFAGHTVAVLGRDRRVLAAMLAVGVAFLALKAGSFAKLGGELRFIRATHGDLVATLRDPAVVRARGCGPLTLPTYRLVPDTKWILDSADVGARSTRRPATGVELVLVGEKAIKRYGRADGASPRTNTPDPDFALVARHGSVSAYARCR